MEKHLIHESLTLIDALCRLNELSGKAMTLFVTGNDAKMTGTLTDGDIRRALVKGASLGTRIDEVMHRNYRYIQGDEINVEEIRRFRLQGITLIPWLHNDGKIKKIVDLSEYHTILPLSAILMAGGKGERLRPLTLEMPKPLLRIGEKAIIDYNIEALARCGITDITVTTRYLSEKIHEHFRNPVAGVRVKCVKEEAASGTIGSASLVDLPPDGYTLVMNSDLLTTISFEDMYLHHVSNNADITIAAIPYQVSIPFAILTTDKEKSDKVIGLEEKPSYSYYANAGIYIFPNSVLKNVPSIGRTDATDLIEQSISQGMTVSLFPLNGTWIDVGTPADFRQANELIKYVKTI